MMGVLHLMVGANKQPTILVTEAYNFGVFYVLPGLTILVPEPFMKSLNCEPCCPQTGGHGFR